MSRKLLLSIAAAICLAVAVTPQKAGAQVIYVCKTTTGTLYEVQPGATCPRGVAPLALNTIGPQGPPGPTGAAGPAGATGAAGQNGTALAAAQFVCGMQTVQPISPVLFSFSATPSNFGNSISPSFNQGSFTLGQTGFYQIDLAIDATETVASPDYSAHVGGCGLRY
jgi:hypothetical protein